MKSINKISLANVNKIRGGFKNLSDRFLGMRVVGVVRGYDTLIDSTMHATEKFYGEFRAENGTGDEFISPICFLPEPAQTFLREAVDSSKALVVEFAFDIHVIPDRTLRAGCRFEIEHVVEAKTCNALDALVEKVKASDKIVVVEKTTNTKKRPDPIFSKQKTR